MSTTIPIPSRRCSETRAHYAHRWVDAANWYVDCPGGPDENECARCDCTCGFGGEHLDNNPRCELNEESR
jgi:hypothetical protein